MSENIRFSVVDMETKTIGIALGISLERKAFLIEKMQAIVEKESQFPKTRLNLAVVLSELSHICENPQELAFISFLLNAYITYLESSCTCGNCLPISENNNGNQKFIWFS